jgi:hypothetical protein
LEREFSRLGRLNDPPHEAETATELIYTNYRELVEPEAGHQYFETRPSVTDEAVFIVTGLTKADLERNLGMTT